MSQHDRPSHRILARLEGTSEMIGLLDRFADWLTSEAQAAGGIGPNEHSRLEDRHIADSLAPAECWFPRPPASLADLGSGAGLPGIPLAILHASTPVTLVDRSGRRCHLLRRVARILALENIRVIEADVDAVDGSFEVVLARGLASPERLWSTLDRLVSPDGLGLVLGSRSRMLRVPGFTTREVGVGILDPPSWVLMMERPDRRDTQ